MPDSLASQVAAGEVVERPASVVKELVENSLDAGARRIEVLAERGGAALLRVVDDGSGMSREDALLSLERHATSKLRCKEDLSRVTTFGFRGEALPSIASVSRFRLATREPGALAGTEIVIEGGVLRDVRDSGEAPGTQIEVRSLFYNVPARRKFLRAEATEFGHIEGAIRVAAISRPDVAFSLRHGTRQVLQLGAAGDRLERISDLAGSRVAEQLVALPEMAGRGGLRISGWVARPGFSRPNRGLQYTFLNGRPIECSAVSYGLREAYAGLLERGQHPPVFLFIAADPSSVDVNVHPAKREVRFHDGRGVQQLVAEAVQHALTEQVVVSGGITEAPRLRPPAGQTPSLTAVPAHAPTPPTPDAPEAATTVRVRVSGGERPASSAGTTAHPAGDREMPGISPAEAPAFRVLGSLGKRYLVLESDDGLVLLHRRAAHERVLYERALAALQGANADGQTLLGAAVLELSPEDLQVALAHLETLEKLGVGLTPFGGNSVKIDCIPAGVGDVDPGEFVANLIADLREGGASAGRRSSTRDIAAAVSHRAARYYEATHAAEQKALISDLLRCEMPYCDARGRPTLIQFSHQELARKFGEG